METKLLTYILLGIIVVMGFTIVNDRYLNPPDPVVKTDTIRVDRPFKVETLLPQDEVIPEIITLWEIDTSLTLQKIELTPDTVRVYMDTSFNPIQYSPYFLTNYPSAPKFLELKLSSESLDFTGMKPNGEVQSNSYSLNLSENTYRLAPKGNGWVGLGKDRKYSFLGLRFDFKHSLSAGNSWILEEGQIELYPSLKWNPELEFYHKTSLFGSVGLDYGTITGTAGIKYQFR